MPLLTLNLSCENVKYPARKHFEKTNSGLFKWEHANKDILMTCDIDILLISKSSVYTLLN